MAQFFGVGERIDEFMPELPDAELEKAA
jgi:hypothetical protein